MAQILWRNKNFLNIMLIRNCATLEIFGLRTLTISEFKRKAFDVV